MIPFFGYARQDRKDQPRVPITAKLVANLLVASGVHRVLTMDLHAQQLQGFFDIPVDNIYGTSILVDDIQRKIREDFIVVSPDVGGVVRARAMAKRLGDFIIFVVLSVITLGFYPIYFWVTRTKERNDLLAEILVATRNR